MKTEALVDKYQKLVAGLIKGANPKEITFLVQEYGEGDFQEIGAQYKFSEYKPDLSTRDWCHGCYRAMFRKDVLSTFKLYQMPHCCGILVSCNALVSIPWRNMRIGTVLNNLRQDIGRALGYTVILCTDIETNAPQRRLLATNGWKDILDFKNRRTGNKVYLAYISL